jgi:transaldolase/glucose-6-phosphate isomerase
MGGSSLAPEVFQSVFGNAPGHPGLIVLDSTHPDAVRDVEARIDLGRTLFVVSSKSGTTIETLSGFRYFWQRALDETREPGLRFMAITDPGTPLETLANDRRFRALMHAPSDVGGRYSALTVFGLAPAALIGADLDALARGASAMAAACGPDVDPRENPALLLGAALGELALAGRDKLTLVASPSFAALPAWIEQLVAESAGKEGRGIVPVAGEPLGPASLYGPDRVFAVIAREGEDPDGVEAAAAALAEAGHPVIRLTAGDASDLGAEFFRWEMAAAAACAVLGVNPFDQPDVESAKKRAREAMQEGPAGAAEDAPVARPGGAGFERAVEAWIARARPGDYVAIQAFLAPRPRTDEALAAIREALRARTRLATTLGYGPRYLHSSGQLHKGGPDTGLFLQIVDEPSADVTVPETDFSFGAIIAAQSLGDARALRERGRRVLRLDVGRDAGGGLETLARALG